MPRIEYFPTFGSKLPPNSNNSFVPHINCRLARNLAVIVLVNLLEGTARTVGWKHSTYTRPDLKEPSWHWAHSQQVPSGCQPPNLLHFDPNMVNFTAPKYWLRDDCQQPSYHHEEPHFSQSYASFQPVLPFREKVSRSKGATQSAIKLPISFLCAVYLNTNANEVNINFQESVNSYSNNY